MNRISQRPSQGFSLVELIIAIGIFMVLISGIIFFATGSYTEFVGGGDNAQKERFAREALQVLEIIKERSWLIIADASDGSTQRKVSKDGQGDWVIGTGTEVRGSFTRAIVLYDVNRDSNGEIVTSPAGMDDPATKRAVVTVSAAGKANYALSAFLTNWEAYRMQQSAYTGTNGVTTWVPGQDDWDSSSSVDVPTSSGRIELNFQ